MARCVASEPTDVIAFDRPGLRSLLASSPEFGELVLGCLLARRAWHEDSGPRRAAPDRPARLQPRLRGARPARAQPGPAAGPRRRHRPDRRQDPRLARHPPRRDADPRPQRQGAAQPLRGAGGARPRAARRGRRPAVRPGRAGRRAGRPGGRGLRRLGGPAHVRRRGLGPGRAGRHQHPHRELPRLPQRHLRHRADPRGDAAGAPLRRGAVELPPRRRAHRRPRGPRARRPRRRPARARPDGGDGDRRPLARARGAGRGALPRRGPLPRGDARRRRALPRRGRDRGRRRQLGRAGGHPPGPPRAQRAHGRARPRPVEHRCPATSSTASSARPASR